MLTFQIYDNKYKTQNKKWKWNSKKGIKGKWWLTKQCDSHNICCTLSSPQLSIRPHLLPASCCFLIAFLFLIFISFLNLLSSFFLVLSFLLFHLPSSFPLFVVLQSYLLLLFSSPVRTSFHYYCSIARWSDINITFINLQSQQHIDTLNEILIQL